MVEIDEDFKKVLRLLAQDDDEEPPRLVEPATTSRAAASTIKTTHKKSSARTTTSTTSSSISSSAGIVKCRHHQHNKKGGAGKRSGISLAVISQLIYKYLQKYGKYNIHMDNDNVFNKRLLESKPDNRRIYDAVRWLEGFGLAKREQGSSVDKSTVFLIFPEDKSTLLNSTTTPCSITSKSTSTITKHLTKNIYPATPMPPPHHQDHTNHTNRKKPERKLERRKIDLKNHPGKIITDYLKKFGRATKEELCNVLKEKSSAIGCNELTLRRNYSDAIAILGALGMICSSGGRGILCKESGKVKWLGNPRSTTTKSEMLLLGLKQQRRAKTNQKRMMLSAPHKKNSTSSKISTTSTSTSIRATNQFLQFDHGTSNVQSTPFLSHEMG